MNEQGARISRIVWGEFRLDGGAVFGVVPRTLWTRRVPPDEFNRVTLVLTSLLVESGSHKVLLDCGMWPGFPDKLRDGVYAIVQPPMAETFRQVTGMEPTVITDVVPSHLHFDHVGGFFQREGDGYSPTFPNARLHVQQRQLAWAGSPSIKDSASYVTELTRLVESYDRLVVHPEAWSLDWNMSFSLAQGHTPDMVVSDIQTPSGTVIHTGDVVFLEAAIPVPWVGAFDIRPLDTVEEKLALYRRGAGATLYLGHEPRHPFCRLEEDSSGKWNVTHVNGPHPQ
jgi:glyoxylase-like metal-dependent hydrolase (beta-lactamase superfamily II)